MKKIFSLLLLSAMALTAGAANTAADAPAEDAAPTAGNSVLPAAGNSRDADDTDHNILRAALKGWHVRLGAGFNVGGTSPLPLPREIRSINSYNPCLNVAINGEVRKSFEGSPWGLAIGVRLEAKGMKTDARVKNYHMEAVNADGSGRVVGAWTGNVKTRVDNDYLSFPILATYTINSRWTVTAGPYLSWMINGSFTGEAYDGYIRNIDPTGDKAVVNRATYDFSDDLRRFNWGLQVGGEFLAYKHLAVRADLQWGLNGVFPSDYECITFALYPIYATIGFSYLF